MATTGDADPTLRPIYVAEPPPRYRARPPAVVDSSLLCALLYEEPEEPQAVARMAPYDLRAPSVLPYEVANVAMNKVRRGADPDAVRRGLAGFVSLPIELIEVDPLRAFDLALRWRLSAYDAAYLVLAEVLRCPLLTFDQRLAQAAQQHLSSLE